MNWFYLVGVENDSFALAVAGYTSTVDFLKLLCGYKDETEYIVWNDLFDNLSQLALVLQNTDVFKEFKQFVIGLCKPALQRLGTSPKDGEGEIIINLNISWLGMFQLFTFHKIFNHIFWKLYETHFVYHPRSLCIVVAHTPHVTFGTIRWCWCSGWVSTSLQSTRRWHGTHSCWYSFFCLLVSSWVSH